VFGDEQKKWEGKLDSRKIPHGERAKHRYGKGQGKAGYWTLGALASGLVQLDQMKVLGKSRYK